LVAGNQMAGRKYDQYEQEYPDKPCRFKDFAHKNCFR